MRQKLLKLYTKRLEDEITNYNPLKILKTLDPLTVVDLSISAVYLYTRPKRKTKNTSIYMAEIISAVGHSVRNKFKLKRDSALSAKIGAFLLYNFEALGTLQVILGGGGNGHNQYIVQVLDDEAISALWSTVPLSVSEKLPSETPYDAWETSRHPTGARLVKTQNQLVLSELQPDTHPIVFDCVNRAQSVGWLVNKPVYDLHLWALKNRVAAFDDIWKLTNPEARVTKTREAKAIGDIAKRFIGKTFYHLYSLDFRGRKYPNTAYFHEQGSDLARGLLLRADAKPIGHAGFFWLMVSIASNWAGDAGREDKAKTDKISLKDRFAWASDNEEIFLSYAESPKVNQGWMQADKPWQFIAACIELMNFRIWQGTHGDFDSYDYVSHLECYIDGSNNGSQHLSALTKDEITAPHVNLVPLDLPGDLYKHVGDHVWEHLQRLVDAYTVEQRSTCESFIDDIMEMKRVIAETEPKSEARTTLVEAFRQFKEDFAEINTLASPVFWLRIKDPKHQRKVVKRNTMTLPYGGTSYGLGEQQISDAKKHGIDMLHFMEHRWGAFMGRAVYDDCKRSLAKPMQLLTVFEKAGAQAEAEGRYLSWRLPITKFLVVQNYTEGAIHKIWVQYGPPVGPRLSTNYYENTLQMSIAFIEDTIPSKGKQAQGASPNAIHSLDAAHLMLTVHRCPFNITTIHDSFGCLLADMPVLFKTVRETFVELYAADPLSSLIRDINGDLSDLELGTLDLTLLLESEYCFA